MASRRSCIVLLPESLVCDILSRLPAACLLRLKSVCKWWYDLIQSPFFINSHLRRHHDDKNNYNLFIMNPRFKFQIRFGLHFCLRSCENFEYSREIHLPNLSKTYIPTLSMVTCNGLICLYFDWIKRPDYIYYLDVFLWNPATKHFRALPRPVLPARTHRIDSRISIGFCFDTIANDYKLVMIFIYNERSQFQVQVYSLSTNSWTTINVVFPFDCVKSIGSDPKAAPYQNGIYYWFGKGTPVFENHHELYDHCILSFDFGTDKFGTVPLPDAFSVKGDPDPQFAIINGNIACINRETPVPVDYYTATDDTSHVEIWVLNEYGVKESWTKLYTVGPFYYPLPRGILKNRFLMLGDLSQLDLYDILTGEIKNVTEEEDQVSWFGEKCVQFAMYKESLVSIKGRDDASGGTTSEDNYDWDNLLPRCYP